VFLLSTKAGGVGINLTAANQVVFLDISYNPQNDKQAEDRAHRIGQEKEVNVYRLISTGTIDDEIYITHRKKRQIARSVLQDEDEDEAAQVRQLLDRYLRRPVASEDAVVIE
jgi:SNF2 family DNA or RNA helicase